MARHDREDPHLEDQLAWLDAIKEMPDEVEIAVSAVTSATLARPQQPPTPPQDEDAEQRGGHDTVSFDGQGTGPFRVQDTASFGVQRAEQPAAVPESASPYPPDPWRLVPSDSLPHPLAAGPLTDPASGPFSGGTTTDGAYGAPPATDTSDAGAPGRDSDEDRTAALGRGAFASSPADTDSYSLGGLGAFGDSGTGGADGPYKSWTGHGDDSSSSSSSSASSAPGPSASASDAHAASSSDPGSDSGSGSSSASDSGTASGLASDSGPVPGTASDSSSDSASDSSESPDSSESSGSGRDQPLRGWLEPAVPVNPSAKAASANPPAREEPGFGHVPSPPASSARLSQTFPAFPAFPSPVSPGSESTPRFASADFSPSDFPSDFPSADRSDLTPAGERPDFAPAESKTPTPFDDRPFFTSHEFGTGEYGIGTPEAGHSDTGDVDTGEIAKPGFAAGPANEPTADRTESGGFPDGGSTGPLGGFPVAEAREAYERNHDPAGDWDGGPGLNDRDRGPGAEREHEQHQRDRAASGEREPYQPRRRPAPTNHPFGGQSARGTGTGSEKPTADSLDPDSLLRGRRNAPTHGWRRLVYRASAGLIKPGEPAEVRRRRELMNRVRTPVAGGHHRVAVLSLKGGVGKTTTTVGLGATLAQVRGDRVIAVDANPDRGTLSDKVELETAATVRDLLNERAQITRYVDIRAFTSQTPSRLEILASDRDPSVSEAFSAADYHAVAQVLENFYSICITDCGTGLLHSAMSGVLGMADQIVLVSSPSVDGARAASATLDWLEAHRYDDLVRAATVVLSSVRPRSKSTVDLNKLESHFAARCRAVVRVPYDPHLEEGAEIDLDRLQEATRDAYLRLAASVGDGFAGAQALTQRRFSEIPDHL